VASTELADCGPRLPWSGCGAGFVQGAVQTSLVAAEIHLGRRSAASATADRTATFKLHAISIPREYLMKSASYFEDLKLAAAIAADFGHSA
jgi:hypothetical protein